MEKIDKTVSPYIDVVDESNVDSMLEMKLRMILVDKINEIVDWINSQ
tara:strand:+ start:587 stop:727 length:141 start_codon:yes stop_codon:yes gene_type:complete